jgi:hypothetical protein
MAGFYRVADAQRANLERTLPGNMQPLTSAFAKRPMWRWQLAATPFGRYSHVLTVFLFIGMTPAEV